MVDQVPAITDGPATTLATVGTAYAFTYIDTGVPAPTFSLLSGSTLPSGLTLSSAGVISGTPTAVGTFTGTVDAGNGVGLDATQGFAIVIDQVPAINSSGNTTLTVGSAGSFTIVDSGVPGPTLSESSVLPSGVTFMAGMGILSGTPAAGTGGTYALAFVASNGVGAAATQSFTLTVDQAPAITSSASATFAVGQNQHLHGYDDRFPGAGSQ